MLNQSCGSDDPSPVIQTRRLDRRQAIIQAAESLFFEQGYEATSLAAVVKRSGGSLATLYELFGNKQGLLRAIVEHREEQDRCPGCDETTAHCRPGALLTSYGQRLYDHFTSPRSIALKRIVMTEALRDPDFARSLYENVHLPAVRELSAILARLVQEGRAEIDDPMAAANLFFAIVIADAPIQTLVGGKLGPDDGKTIAWRLAPFLSHFRIP